MSVGWTYKGKCFSSASIALFNLRSNLPANKWKVQITYPKVRSITMEKQKRRNAKINVHLHTSAADLRNRMAESRNRKEKMARSQAETWVYMKTEIKKPRRSLLVKEFLIDNSRNIQKRISHSQQDSFGRHFEIGLGDWSWIDSWRFGWGRSSEWWMNIVGEKEEVYLCYIERWAGPVLEWV